MKSPLLPQKTTRRDATIDYAPGVWSDDERAVEGCIWNPLLTVDEIFAGPGPQQHPFGYVPPPAHPLHPTDPGGMQPKPPGTEYGSGSFPTQHVSLAGHTVLPPFGHETACTSIVHNKTRTAARAPDPLTLTIVRSVRASAVPLYHQILQTTRVSALFVSGENEDM